MPEPVRADRWEQGSTFDLDLEAGSAAYPWDAGPSTLWGSGRAAMRGLLAFGRTRGWRRLLVPSYMCQTVAGSLVRELPAEAYPFDPISGPRGPVRTRDGDAVLVIHAFGRRMKPEIRGPGVVIEDYTHDLLAPWATASTAGYAVASLRKLLPVPEGGVLWSPRGLELPPERPATARHARGVADRLAAMTLKRLYLGGAGIDKDGYRALVVRGEAELDQGAISGISAYTRERLPTFPIAAWRERKAANLAAFRRAVDGTPGVTVLDAPFAATLVFDSPDRRQGVYRALIGERIYPAILWPLESPVIAAIPDRDVELSRRLMTIHADQRYGPADMERVADAVRRAAVA